MGGQQGKEGNDWRKRAGNKDASDPVEMIPYSQGSDLIQGCRKTTPSPHMEEAEVVLQEPDFNLLLNIHQEFLDFH